MSFARSFSLTSQRAMMAAISPLLDASQLREDADGNYERVQ